jgi:hypothetical protein
LYDLLRDLAGPVPGTAASKGDSGFEEPTSSDPAAKTANLAAEILNSRLAVRITPDIIGKLSGYLFLSAGLKFADVPHGLAAISKEPAAGWGLILAYTAFCETSQD